MDQNKARQASGRVQTHLRASRLHQKSRRKQGTSLPASRRAREASKRWQRKQKPMKGPLVASKRRPGRPNATRRPTGRFRVTRKAPGRVQTQARASKRLQQVPSSSRRLLVASKRRPGRPDATSVEEGSQERPWPRPNAPQGVQTRSGGVGWFCVGSGRVQTRPSASRRGPVTFLLRRLSPGTRVQFPAVFRKHGFLYKEGSWDVIGEVYNTLESSFGGRSG